MLKLEYSQHLKGCLQNYLIFHRTEDLVCLFVAIVSYSVDILKVVPKLNIQELFENSYELDDMDLRLAFRELNESMNLDSIENLMFVICMLYKGFGLTFADFKRNLEEILDNQPVS